MQTGPTVQRKRKTRSGKGFSRAELKGAGANLRQTLKSGIPVDHRRKTRYESNIEILERYLKNLDSRQKKKPRSLSKKKT